jgi:hypothetical protein
VQVGDKLNKGVRSNGDVFSSSCNERTVTTTTVTHTAPNHHHTRRTGAANRTGGLCGSAAGATAAALGCDACPVLNPSVLHKAAGYVALAFAVGLAAGVGFVVGVDVVRAAKSGK